VKFVGGREAGLAVGEDNFELAGIDGGVGREGPLVQIGVIIGEIEAVERDRIGAGLKSSSQAVRWPALL